MQTHEEMKFAEKKLLQSVQGSAKNGPFLPVIKIVNSINEIHNFSKLLSIYCHKGNRNGFLMSVLVGIVVLHMHLAENSLSSTHLTFWQPFWWPSMFYIPYEEMKSIEKITLPVGARFSQKWANIVCICCKYVYRQK